MLQVSFIMIYINRKILVLLKITRILKHCLKSMTDFHLKYSFFKASNYEKFKDQRKQKYRRKNN